MNTHIPFLRATTALLMLSCVATFAFAQTGTINLNGKTCTIDTTVYYQAGPGIQYTAFTLNISNSTHPCYLLETDLTNPYNSVEEHPSRNKATGSERLVEAAANMDRAGHRTIGGVNCDFWIMGSQVGDNDRPLVGAPWSGTATNGIMVTEPSNWNGGHGDRGCVMIDRQKRVWIDNATFAGKAMFQNQEYPIMDVNRPRVSPCPDELTLFNQYSTPTRATSGTEIVFRPTLWRINGVMDCEVISINHTGATALTDGLGALQGTGTGKSFADRLQVGDRFEVQLGVVATHSPETLIDINHMTTGNALLLYNGQQTDRNTNESYNNQNYPRTVLATNATRDRLWMMVAQKPGMYTADMCALLQTLGATEAAGMDGGGSAQMCLFGNVVNPTTEGSPRAVASSLWVFSTAPDDNVIATLASSVYSLRLPKYGVCKPSFKGYNQYGVLLDHDLQGVVLSCDPNVGYIDETGAFVCLGNGTLYARYGEAEVSIAVEMLSTAAPAIRLDSVLVSNNTNYAIEVTALVNGEPVGLQSGALTWSVQDESIASVSNQGVLNGITNGRTWVYGVLDGVKDSLLVRVEIPESQPLLWAQDLTGAPFVLTGSATSWHTNATFTDLGTQINFTYSVARQPNIKLTANTTLYSLPDYFELRLNPQDCPVQKVSIIFQAANSKKLFPFNYGALQNNEMNSVVVNLDSTLGHPNDIAVFPIQLNSITLNLDASATAKDYTLLVEGIYLHYGALSMGLESVTGKGVYVYPNPASETLHLVGIETGTARVLDLSGKVMLSQVLCEGQTTLSIQGLPQGQYLLQVGDKVIRFIRN